MTAPTVPMIDKDGPPLPPLGEAALESTFIDYLLDKFPVFETQLGRAQVEILYAAICQTAAHWLVMKGQPLPLGFCELFALPQRVDYWMSDHPRGHPANAALIYNTLLWSLHVVPAESWLQAMWDYENAGLTQHGPAFHHDRWKQLVLHFDAHLSHVSKSYRSQANVPRARVVENPETGGLVLAPA